MKITQKPFGITPEGKQATLYTLTNSNGASVSISDFGCTLVSIFVPDKSEELSDVLLGYDDIAQYAVNPGYFGAVCGRYANRLEGACFTLNGKNYKLFDNDKGASLHGGKQGFSHKIFHVEPIENGIALSYISPHMEEGYPGELSLKVSYTWTDDCALTISYGASSSEDTIINITNHAYFNLSGEADILNHELKLNSEKTTPINASVIPTGEIESVIGTPLDFIDFHKIGERINEDHSQIKYGSGYDHNFIITKSAPNAFELCAELYSEKSGRFMETFTTKPAIQIYTGNFVNTTGKGKNYAKNAGVCLETQYYPNSMKHAHFPSPILKAGELYSHQTQYRFSVK